MSLVYVAGPCHWHGLLHILFTQTEFPASSNMNTTRPFLLLQLRPEDATSNGEFEAIMRYGELSLDEVHRIRIEETGIPPLELDQYCAIIVGGSPFDISTPENHKKEIQKKIEKDFEHLFDRVVPLDFPFLGACSGNGLLGSYLGAPISRRYAESVKGATLTLTDEGRNDPLLAGFPDQIRVLLGHKEACDEVPDGASLLLRGQACPVQMFRVGNNIYATQFHPEGDSEGFAIRINTYRDHGYFPSDEADAIIEAVSHEDTPYSREILRRFVSRYRS
jgi:GMP synthase (glutamine-hydrolysing)